MSQFWALTWAVKQGSEQQVEELFRASGRPDHVVRGPDGEPRGRLLSTLVFMKDSTVVRVIEFEGEFADVAQHMGRQQEVVDLERKLDEHLAVPRDMSTPEGVREFFRSAAMRPVLVRRHDDP
jgi:hypothetical protein